MPTIPSAALVALGVFTAACAPGPRLDGPDHALSQGEIAETDITIEPDSEVPRPTPGEQLLLEPDTVDGRIAVHDGMAAIRTGDRRIELEAGDLPSQPTWSRDGSRLITVSLDGRLPVVDVFDGSTGEALGRAFAERLYFFFSWSHDGSRIAALGPGVGGTTLDILDPDGNVVHSEVVAAASLYLAWEPDGQRLVTHADEALLRVEPDGAVVDLGRVGLDFFAPKWIPGTSEIVLVADIEGTSTLVRRGVEFGDSMTTLGPVTSEAGISVNPDGQFVAISTLAAGGGGGARRTGGTTPLGQAGPAPSGLVEIVDLDTGERVIVLEARALWTEWNVDGSSLLISAHDGSSDVATWWVYETAPLDEEAVVFPVISFIPAPIFFRSYLAFADQFIEQPRLWSPSGDEFVFAELTADGSLVRTAPAVADAVSELVGAGEVGFWSPSR